MRQRVSSMKNISDNLKLALFHTESKYQTYPHECGPALPLQQNSLQASIWTRAIACLTLSSVSYSWTSVPGKTLLKQSEQIHCHCIDGHRKGDRTESLGFMVLQLRSPQHIPLQAVPNPTITYSRHRSQLLSDPAAQ